MSNLALQPATLADRPVGAPPERDDGGRAPETRPPSLGAMLFMESWPAAVAAEPGEATVLLPAPYVVACAHAAVVMDLHRQDVDMVVWGRRTPETWQDAIGPVPSAATCDYSGAPQAIREHLVSSVDAQVWPPVIRDDVAELSALLAALTGDLPQRLRLLTAPPGDVSFERAPGVMRLVCGYGTAGMEWRTSPLSPDLTALLPPYAVAFIKGPPEGEDGCLHRVRGEDGAPGVHLVLDTLVA